MCGVAGGDHAEITCRFGQGRRGLCLLHIAFERFLLLQQRLVGLASAAELI
jgi:hypothetical protein